MRNAFADEITALAGSDHRIVLLSGDIGNRLFNRYKQRYPQRFFNCGVAEANMTGVAAGMAACGLRPVSYTITPFNTVRCLEQIKIDVCYQNLPVIIVGVGAGLAYAGLGATHHACEDIAVMRVLPNMQVICPGDAVEVRLALREALRQDKPAYIRLGKKNEPVVHQAEPQFKIGKGLVIRSGEDVCLLSTGNMLPIAMETCERLNAQHISAQVVSMHTVKPLDTDFLIRAFAKFKVIATLEEHSIYGGFGAAIAEWLVDQPPQRGRLCRTGIEDKFLHGAGDQENARQILGLTSKTIAEKIVQRLKESRTLA